jgi:hypothetical protein
MATVSQESTYPMHEKNACMVDMHADGVFGYLLRDPCDTVGI